MTVADTLDLKIDEICERIERGDSLRTIATSFGLIPMQLTRWIGDDPERSKRARDAREASAYESDELALKTLQDESIEIARAREIASHYRWRAKTRKPREFGDRQEIDLHARIELTDEQLSTRLGKLLEKAADAEGS